MVSFDTNLKELMREVIKEELSKLKAPSVETTYLSIDEAATVASVCKSTLRNWLKNGLLFSKTGSTVRISRKDLDSFLAGKRKLTPTELAKANYKG